MINSVDSAEGDSQSQTDGDIIIIQHCTGSSPPLPKYEGYIKNNHDSRATTKHYGYDFNSKCTIHYDMSRKTNYIYFSTIEVSVHCWSPQDLVRIECQRRSRNWSWVVKSRIE